MAAESRICPHCQRSFGSDELVCPEDGTRLIGIHALDLELIGQTLDDKFTLLEVIGRGAYGVVYKALQLSMHRHVAIKVLQRSLVDNETAVKRFLQEVKAASQISQANVVTIHDFGQTAQGVLYIAMELLSGQTLRRSLSRGRPWSPQRTASVLAQICDALEVAHAKGIIHRDLKPENVFLVGDGEGIGAQVKLLDFGMAKLLAQQGQDLTRSGLLCGTPIYMSPEQAATTPVGAASDIYSLGVIAFECLTGSPPFREGGPMKVLMSHLHDPVPSLELPAGYGPMSETKQLVEEMLSKDAAARPASAREVKERLLAAIDIHATPLELFRVVGTSDSLSESEREADTVALRDTLVATRPMSPRSTRRLLLGLLASLTLVSSLGVWWLYWSDRPAPDDAASTYAGEPVYVTWTPYQDAKFLTENTRWIRDILSRYAERPFELKISESYDGAIGLILAGEVALASLSPRAYVLAKEREPGLELLGRELVGGASTYQSFIVTREDSSVIRLADVRGKKVCFVDPASASGYLYPRVLLREAGLDPDHDLAEVVFVGSHPGVARALAEGRCVVGGIASSALTQWREQAGLAHNPSALRVIATSAPIPGDAVVMRRGLESGLADRIRAGFSEVLAKSARGEQPRELKSGGYVRATDADYDPVRKVSGQDR